MKRPFFRAARSRISAAIDGVVRSFSPRDPELYRGREEIPGVELTPFTVMQLDAVWGCVRLIAETIAALPLGMYERTGKAGRKYAGDHPLHFIIHDQPNVDSTAVVFWEAFVASMLLRGAGRAEKLMIGERVVGLSFLDPSKFVRRRDVDGRVRDYYPRADGSLREIPRSKLFEVPGFTLNGRDGVSVIAYGAKVFGGAMAAERAATRVFTTGLLQTIYYKVAAFLKDTQRKEFRENVLGTVERGETPLLEGGTEMASVGIKPEDAQLLASRGYGVEMICRWFRVDPTMIGHGEKASNWGTGLEQKMIGFLTFTLSPLLVRIEQGINKDLLSVGDRVRFYAKFAIEGLLRADSAARAAFYSVMVNNGVLTRDEVRELEEREPMGGNAAVLTVQSAMIPLDSMAAKADPAENQLRDSLRALLGFSVNEEKDPTK